MATILLVDDEAHFRDRLARALGRRGHQVLAAADYAEAMDLLSRERPELAVVDLRMPGPSGLELVKAALAALPSLKIVVLTGYGSIATATEAIRLGALNYLPKPADAEEILAAFMQPGAAPVSETPEDISTPSLARAEWEHINRVLTDCGGNISEAAKRLQLHRRTLQRKLGKFPPLD
ncbi:MAG: response regulator [Desulfobulbaceae bacterium]|nr:response regulator [Desulfobulbaceae bacterium]